MARVVRCKDAWGMNMSFFQFFGSGPLWTIVCGDCGSQFKKRILMVDSPRVRCPLCDAINEIPVTV